ncbi:MAG: hypothetical protein ACXACC_07610 [Promethearchaeota archaeon]|jgi:hypothetical protein
MPENFENSQIEHQSQPNNQNDIKEAGLEKEVIEKDFVPHFLPTYRISSKFYALPIILVVVIAGVLSYLTYIEAGVQLDGGYISEEEFGALGGILNGVIFTVMAAASAFLIIYLVKKRGIDVLKYIFGLSFGFLSFFLSLFFSSIIVYLIFLQFPESQSLVHTYYAFTNILLPIYVGIFTLFLLYGYFTSKSIIIKNIIVLYMGLLVGASMGVLMPLWTTLAILIGISIWDIFAVLYKKGPIKEMIDIASQGNDFNGSTKKDIQEKIESGEAVYDTSKLEIGIGDLAFYSMLTSSALIQANSVIVMISTSIAIIIGTGITIMGLRRNKILPGLPISIFLGIGTMLISWYIVSII